MAMNAMLYQNARGHTQYQLPTAPMNKKYAAYPCTEIIFAAFMCIMEYPTRNVIKFCRFSGRTHSLTHSLLLTPFPIPNVNIILPFDPIQDPPLSLFHSSMVIDPLPLFIINRAQYS